MSQVVYTQENVPEDIARRFPGIFSKYPKATVASTIPAEQDQESQPAQAASIGISQPFAPVAVYQVPLPAQTILQSSQVVAVSNPLVLSNSVLLGGSSAQAATYTQDNVPEEISKRFPGIKVSASRQQQVPQKEES